MDVIEIELTIIFLSFIALQLNTKKLPTTRKHKMMLDQIVRTITHITKKCKKIKIKQIPKLERLHHKIQRP